MRGVVRGECESVVAQGLRELDRARERGFQYARLRGRGKCCGAGDARIGQGAGARIPICAVARARVREVLRGGRGKCCGTFISMGFKIFYQNSFVLNNKEDMAMILVLACLFSFLTGAGIALAAQEVMLRREGNADHVAETVTEIPQEQAAELREQWVNFLSYDGSDQNGGF